MQEFCQENPLKKVNPKLKDKKFENYFLSRNHIQARLI
jgi:hypothetical protein